MALLLRVSVAVMAIAIVQAFNCDSLSQFDSLVYDPSVDNHERPQILDTRPNAFGMTAREALRIIDKIQREEADCGTMLETRSMEVLRIKYENSVYKQQAHMAIRTANLISDLLPSGSAKAKQSEESVFLNNKNILFGIVRNNVESDGLIFGSAVIFSAFPNFTWYAPYAYRNLHDPFIKVKDLSTTWSYLHELFVNFVRLKSVNRPFPRRTTFFYPRRNDTSDFDQVNLTHYFAESLDGLWTRPYYECTTSKAWQITYTVPIIGNWSGEGRPRFL